MNCDIPQGNLEESDTTARWYLNFKKRNSEGKTLRTASKATIRRIFHLTKCDNPKLFIAGTKTNPPSRHLKMLQRIFAQAKDDDPEPESDHDILLNYTMQFNSEAGALNFEEWQTKNINRYEIQSWTLTTPENIHNRNLSEPIIELDDEFNPSQDHIQQNGNPTLTFTSLTQDPISDTRSQDKEEADDDQESLSDDQKDTMNPQPGETLSISDSDIEQTATSQHDFDEPDAKENPTAAKNNRFQQLSETQQSPLEQNPNPIINLSREARRGYYEELKGHCQKTVQRFFHLHKNGTNIKQATLNATHALIRFCIYHNITTKADCVQNALTILNGFTDRKKVIDLINEVKKEEQKKMFKKKIISKEGIPLKEWSFDLNENFGVTVNKTRKKRRLPPSFQSLQPPQKRGRLSISKSLSSYTPPLSPISSAASLTEQRRDLYSHEMYQYTQALNNPSARHWTDHATNAQIASYSTTANPQSDATRVQKREIENLKLRLMQLENAQNSSNATKINPATIEIREMVNRSDRGFETLGIKGVDKEPTIEACVKRANVIISQAITDKSTQKLNQLLNQSSNSDLTRVLEGVYPFYVISHHKIKITHPWVLPIS